MNGGGGGALETGKKKVQLPGLLVLQRCRKPETVQRLHKTVYTHHPVREREHDKTWEYCP